MHSKQRPRWWLVTQTRAQRFHKTFKLFFKFLVIIFPTNKVCCHPVLYFGCQSTLPSTAEQIIIQVKWNKCQNFLLTFPPKFLFLIESDLYLIVYPPTGQ